MLRKIFNIFRGHCAARLGIELYVAKLLSKVPMGERGGSVVECRTPEREIGGSKPTAAVLCP